MEIGDALQSAMSFVDAETGKSFGQDEVTAGMTGHMAVHSDEAGFAVLFTMNSSGKFFPISEIVTVAARTLTKVPVCRDGSEVFVKILSRDRGEHPRGGGICYNVVMTRSRDSVASFIERSQKKRMSWAKGELPKASSFIACEGALG